MRDWPRFLSLVGLLMLSCGPLSQARETAPPPRTVLPSGTAATSAIATAALAAYVPPQCQDMAIATLPAATTIARETPSVEANPALDTSAQLSVLDGLVQAVADHYLYPEAAGEGWLSAVSEARDRIEVGMETEAFYAEIPPLVSALGDEHSYFQTPLQIAEEEASLGGTHNVVGVGALFQPLLGEGRATVLGVLEGGPAWYAGIQPHDALLAVDGLPIGEPGLVHRTWTLGPKCSAVVLTIQTPGEAPRDLMLVRWSVSGQLPLHPRLVPTSDGSRIGHLFLPTFLDESLPERVRQALEGLGPLGGLILDNRMNGGGLGSVTEEVMGFFTSGVVGHYASREGEGPVDVRGEPIHNSQDVPLVILVAEGTTSYGEIFPGVLYDIGRAGLVG